jgi:V/A-type H+-transporting ATPase subunit I
MPWQSLDMPLDCTGTVRTAVVTGMLPSAANFAEAQAAVAAVTQEAELFLVSADKDQQYVLLICMKEDQPKIMEALRVFAFSLSTLTGMSGTPRENIASAEKTIANLAAEREGLAAAIADRADKRDEIKLCADRMSTKINSAEAEDKLYGMKSAIVLEGWMLADKEPELEALFKKYDCAWETEDPEPDEYTDVPVKLKNNKITHAMNMVTNIYNLPAYNSLDPNPLMAPFFILFYGLMLADMGYGLLMIIVALLVMKKTRPREGMLTFTQLMLYCGISTFIVGALTGGFFGDAIYQFVHMVNPASTVLTADAPLGYTPLFTPLHDSLSIMLGAMGLGVIQLNTGLAINFYKKWKRGEKMDAIFYEGTFWVILLGIILMVFKISVGKIVLIIGGAALFYGSARGAKGVGGKILAVVACIYNEVTGWFGDILSYSRIMALMLAGSVIGEVFNTIAAITHSPVFFILIFLFGHTLNFGLNLLGCFVHDLRLQCLEYFKKFYEDGGKPFRPLNINTKYYDIAK